MLIDLNETCFNNLVGYWKTMVATNPAALIDTNDFIQINTGIDIPLFNPIFLKNKTEQIPLIKDNLPHSFWHDLKRNKQILNVLEPIMQQVPVMSIELDKEFHQDQPPKVQISCIKNGADLSDWIIPLKIAYQLDENAALRYRYCLEKMQEKFVHFIARDNGKIVASATLYLHDDSAGLYNLSVLPERRKQGIGTALHYARLNEARTRGYKYATLQATPMASKLGESLGFKTQSELSIYKC